MQRTFLLGIAALLLAAPLSYAHAPAGTPKNYCESILDRDTHDFAVGRRDLLVFYSYDGNLADCNGDTVVGDYDGHKEWGYGGGWILAGEGETTPETDGATACFGEAAHHPIFPTIEVTDTDGNPIAFQVGIDWPMGGGDPDPSTPYACGDGIVDPCDPINPAEIDDTTCEANDRLISAFGSVTMTGFPPGQDGSYIVFVAGAAGHIRVNPILPECSDKVDNDHDDFTDYSPVPGLGDPECDSPNDNDESR